MKMCEMKYFTLFCKAYFLQLLTLIMALRFYAAPAQI